MLIIYKLLAILTIAQDPIPSGLPSAGRNQAQSFNRHLARSVPVLAGTEGNNNGQSLGFGIFPFFNFDAIILFLSLLEIKYKN